MADAGTRASETAGLRVEISWLITGGGEAILRCRRCGARVATYITETSTYDARTGQGGQKQRRRVDRGPQVRPRCAAATEEDKRSWWPGGAERLNARPS